MEEARVSASNVKPGMVWWSESNLATCLVVRAKKVQKPGWMAPKIEITTFIVDETSVTSDTFTYEPWELFIADAVLLRRPR